jgi:thioredoxin-related protein
LKNLNWIIVLIISWSSITQLNAQNANWLFDFETAKKAAIEQKAPILLSFSGSDWCIPCMRLEKELFTDSAFIQYANQSLVLLKADFPSKKKNTLSPEQIQHNEALASTVQSQRHLSINVNARCRWQY